MTEHVNLSIHAPKQEFEMRGSVMHKKNTFKSIFPDQKRPWIFHTQDHAVALNISLNLFPKGNNEIQQKLITIYISSKNAILGNCAAVPAMIFNICSHISRIQCNCLHYTDV